MEVFNFLSLNLSMIYSTLKLQAKLEIIKVGELVLHLVIHLLVFIGFYTGHLMSGYNNNTNRVNTGQDSTFK